jgi:cytochrome c2
MPATDVYWRSLKKMHVVFVATSVAMLAATIWMLADDHDREYFDYQRTFDRLKVLKAQAQIAAIRTARFEKDLQALEQRVAEERRKLEERTDDDELKSQIAAKEVELTLAENELKKFKSELSKAVADRDLAIRDEKPESVIRDRRDTYEKKKKIVDTQAYLVERLRADRNGLQQKLAAMTRDYDQAKQKRDDKQKEIALIRKGMLKLAPEDWGKRLKRDIMEWPIIQGFNSHLHVNQDWLPKLPIKLGMAKSARFDRCRTCHLGIDQVEAGNVPAFPHGRPADGTLENWVAEKKYPHPYSTHPNPDLYLTATSPHPVSRFGCTICHDGNGSGTSFQNAEHGPNSPFQAGQWKTAHHYHANHFWEYPMHPKRLVESGCIKCHHSVGELGVNRKFGASAPQLYRGYRLIQTYGCFGCHEIHGFERGESIGPDLRLEPNYTESALQFRYLAQRWKTKKTPSGFTLAALGEPLDRIIDSPEESQAAREKLVEAIRNDLQAKQVALKKLAVQRLSSEDRTRRKAQIAADYLSPEALALADQFKSVDRPGKYRKVGPSLRAIRQKTSRDFIRYWVEEPKRFRPTTRMPQFFKNTNQQDPHAKKLTSVEIAAVAQYLYDKSQPIELLSPPKGYKPDPNRGAEFFAQKGCLACHSHKAMKGATATFGPDLSRIAAKLKRDPGNPRFSRWLYTWIRDPHLYHKRTKMPYLFLVPEEVVQVVGGKRTPVTIDPAADITAFLLQGDAETDKLRAKVFRNHADDRPLAVNSESLDELVTLFLKGKILTTEQVDQFFQTKRYPVTDLSQVKGDEIELARGTAGGAPDEKRWLQIRLNYVGRKTISRYGCFGCHDIPGFEKARPIGTTLQDWGRKDTTKLAFEHIKEYLEHHGEPDGGSTLQRVEQAIRSANANDFPSEKIRERELAAAFFFNSIMHHDRPGFIWQKLRDPRGYDFEKIETKGFDERLRMPKFPLHESDIEAIATFVLGLVAEPPPPEYQYAPTGPAYDRIEGERLLKKYNCIGCHMTSLPRITLWTDLSRPPFGPRPRKKGEPEPLGFDLLHAMMPPREVDVSKKRKKSGQTRLTFRGLRVFDPPEDPEEEDKVYYENWEHLKIGGHFVEPGPTKVSILKDDLVSIEPGRGGDFAEWLYRYLKPRQPKWKNPSERAGLADRVRHQLPPVLYREGYKVQTAWLYRFLRSPHRLRYMPVLRMPRFNLSPHDAQTLANYFAAVEGVPYPYQQVPQRTPDYLAWQNEKYRALIAGTDHPDYLSQSFKLLVNPKLCRVCHSVGGFAAQQGNDPKNIRGPNLEYATDRVRPDWLKLWLARPSWTTPYTAMPVNFKPADDPAKRTYVESFGGDAAVQWVAVRDAIMNYHRLMEQYRGTTFQYPVEKKDENKPPGNASKAVPPKKQDE